MATHIDNSQEMSAEKIKNILTNLIQKEAQKSIAEGKYDTTILAKIQYCTNTSLGQYRIQYQNGYYTAYSADTSKVYSSGAYVYVKVPGNDLGNRLFIDGLATNDNTQRTYLTNLEGDQQFAKIGRNWVASIIDDSKLAMSSYRGSNEIEQYKQGAASGVNNITLISTDEIIRSLQAGDGIRISGQFKTSLENTRKNTGNYGLTVVLRFEKPIEGGGVETYFKTYVLDTFRMDGNPFEFNSFIEKYEHWEIEKADKDCFRGVESIKCFVRGFDEGSSQTKDIEIKDVQIWAVKRIYDAQANDDYKVAITTPDGFIFNFGSPDDTTLRLEGHFYFRGNEITDTRDLKFYWAKKNLAVDSVGHAKYNQSFGKGWQCLNTSIATKSDATDPSKQDLENYTYDAEHSPDGYVGPLDWEPAQSIRVAKRQCKGRQNIVKCCVIYENHVYMSEELTLLNYDGYYVLLKSTEGTEFYNGVGFTDIAAGVFKTGRTSGDSGAFNPNPTGYSVSEHRITYKWEYKNNVDMVDWTPIPPTDSSLLYMSEPDWSDSEDNVNKTDQEVDIYLNNLASTTGIDVNLFKNCKQRFDYYNNYCNTNESSESTEYVRALTRKIAIQINWQNYLDNLYKNTNYENKNGFYITGPSTVTGKYVLPVDKSLPVMYQGNEDPYPYAQVDAVTAITDALVPYPAYYRNTIYRFPASKIVNMAVIRVTALYTDENDITEPLETQEINLINHLGSGFKYDLQIENGTQCFQYSAGGLSPAERSETTTGSITIKPLTFKLYNQEGELVYNSADEEDAKIINQLEPKWKFYNVDTLITTTYSKDLSQSCFAIDNEPGRMYLQNAAIFYYGIARNYNVNYRDRSNIELTVNYDGSTYTASTNFTFVKQGDLGTNGTSMYLDIEEPTYEQYRSDLLSRDEYNAFKKWNGSIETTQYYSPNERHLRNMYMYATQTWSAIGGVKLLANSYNEGQYCNLQFANGVDGSNYYYQKLDEQGNIIRTLYKIMGVTDTTVYGYWYENGKQSMIDADSEWAASDGHMKDVQDQHKLGRSSIYDRASFQFGNTTFDSQGASVNIKLIPPVAFADDTGNTLFYRPMDAVYENNNKTYEWTANNTLQCHAKHTIQEQTDLKGNPMVRHCYGYYTMPFFYYAYYEKRNGAFVNVTPEGLDPARHIVVTGGFDQVLYGADGFNPQYNAQEPFTVHLFNEKGDNITKEAFDSNNVFIEWKGSYGFRQSPITNLDTDEGELPQDYSSFSSTEDLLNKYCKYNNKYWKCVVSHNLSKAITISGHTYAQGEFVTPYWQEVGKYDFKRSQNFTPPNSYESCAVDSLFSSWVSVKVFYTYTEEGTEKKIEGAVLLPVNVLCNAYGSDEINGWDGQKTKVDDGYIISNKVAAGIKDDWNRFVGITIGKKMITNGSIDENEIGLFGYGKYYDGNAEDGVTGYGQTVFIDAETGLAAFGPRGSTQIILNPRVPNKNSPYEQSWSRLAGWYFSPDYLYKPLWADDNYDDDLNAVHTNKELLQLKPPDATGVNIPGSVGMYVPGSTQAGELTSDTVFLWASAGDQVELDWGDNGSLDGLVRTVHRIVDRFNNADFLKCYPHTTQEFTPIVPSVIFNLILRNISEIREVYVTELESEITSGEEQGVQGEVGGGQQEEAGDDIHTAIELLLNEYTSCLRNFTALGIETAPTEYNNVVTAVQTIHDKMNTSGFPTQVVNGTPLVAIDSDGITVENIPELRKWYCDSFVPAVTAQKQLILELQAALDAYEEAYAQFITTIDPQGETPELSDLSMAIGAITAYFEEDTSRVREVQREILNTNLPCIPICNESFTEIINLNDINTYYAVLPATASAANTAQQAALFTDINSYNSIHSYYETWQGSMQASEAVGWKDDKHKAAFYVTYGGKVHCQKAEITGEITALSGEIGGSNASDRIKFCHIEQNPDTGQDEFFLLYNEAFRVKAKDSDNNIKASVYIDGTIMARSGQIGNAAEGTEGDDKHTVFLEYYWYPRTLPDDHNPWDAEHSGSPDFRKPKWDLEQGKIVKYGMWHPYFSIIDDPGGAYNPTWDPQTMEKLDDFDYAAGDAVFMGRIYASGGRLGDWICDGTNNTLRDPYSTIQFKPVLSNDPSRRAEGYINCSQTTLFGDGCIHGGCTSNPMIRDHSQAGAKWWIDPDGVANLILDANNVKVKKSNGDIVTLAAYIQSL